MSGRTVKEALLREMDRMRSSLGTEGDMKVQSAKGGLNFSPFVFAS